MSELEDAGLWEGPLPRDLERLRVAASRLPVPAEPDWDAPRRWIVAPRPAVSPAAWLAMAAGFVALFGALWFVRGGWRVEALDGRPALSGTAFAGRVGAGGIVTTDARSRARLDLPARDEVTLEPGGCVKRIAAPAGECRLELQRGRVRAEAEASALAFVTGAGNVINVDGACALELDESGKGRLDVTAGRATFESDGLSTRLPAGFWCPIGDLGAGVPRRAKSSPAFLAAIAATDDAACQAEDFTPILASAESGDAVSLWHLLPRVQGDVRRQVAERFATLVPVPAGVALDPVLALEPAALEAWWNAIGVGALAEWGGAEATRATR